MLDGLPSEGRLALGGQRGADPGHCFVHDVLADVASGAGADGPGVHGGRTHAAIAMAAIERRGEEGIRELGSGVGQLRVIVRAFDVEVVQIAIGRAIRRGGDDDEAAARAQQGGDPVNQHEVAEMIRRQLQLEAVIGAREGGGHHTGIGDDDVEPLIALEQGLPAGAHAGQRGQIQWDRVEPAAVARRFPDDGGRG